MIQDAHIMLDLKLYGWAGLALGWLSVLTPQEGGGPQPTLLDPESVFFRWPVVAGTVLVTWRVISALNKMDERHSRLSVRINRLAREERRRNPEFRFDDETEDLDGETQ